MGRDAYENEFGDRFAPTSCWRYGRDAVSDVAQRVESIEGFDS